MKAEKKVVSNGHIIEVYEFENGCHFGFTGQGGRRKKEEEESTRAEENRKTTAKKARNNIRRLALANFSEHSKFITLTYKDHVTDIQQSNKLFKKFIQRMRRRYDFKYIAVIEFTKKGRIHYHMLSDLPYIPNKQLNELWSYGFVKINDIRHVDNVGAYMVKYMLKDTHDKRLKGNKSYLTSRGLSRPLEHRGEQAEAILEALELKHKKEVFTNCYESEHHGNIVYKEYNLKRKQ